MEHCAGALFLACDAKILRASRALIHSLNSLGAS